MPQYLSRTTGESVISRFITFGYMFIFWHSGRFFSFFEPERVSQTAARPSVRQRLPNLNLVGQESHA